MSWKRGVFFYAMAGAILAFSSFSPTEVVAEGECYCSLTANYLGNPAEKPCVVNEQITTGGTCADIKVDYTFVLDKTYLVKGAFEILEKNLQPKDGIGHSDFLKLMLGSNLEVLLGPINQQPGICSYNIPNQDIQFYNDPNLVYNYNFSCTSQPISPPPPEEPPQLPQPPTPPSPPAGNKNGCFCMKADEKPSKKDWPGITKEICLDLVKPPNTDNWTVCTWYINGNLAQGDTASAIPAATSPAAPATPASPAPTGASAPAPGAAATAAPAKLAPAVAPNDAVKAWIKANYKIPEGYEKRGGVIPECAFSGTCDNVNDLLQLGINIGKYVFSIIGSVAFLAFVYGGFTIVFSFGSAEKVKKGTEVLVAAVTGMAIAFGAYMLINFILDALSVTADFRGIK